MKQTIEECFEEYLKIYDEEEFDEYSLSELRLCFFAGALAMRLLSKKCTDQAIKDKDFAAAAARMFTLERELRDFVRERDGQGKIRVN